MPSLISRLFPTSAPAAPVGSGLGEPDAAPSTAGNAAAVPDAAPSTADHAGAVPAASNGADQATVVTPPGAAGSDEASVEVITPAAEPGAGTCATCEAPLGAEQEWCLECGAAVARPERGSWRLGLTVAGSLLVLAAICFGLGYVALSDRSQRDAALAGPPTPGQLSSPVSPTPPATTTPVAPALAPVTGGGALPSPAPAKTPVTPAATATPAAGSPTLTPAPSGGSITVPKRSPNPTTRPPRTDPGNQVKANPNQPAHSIQFDSSSAQSFPSGSGSNPGFAVDGNPSTAWSTSAINTGVFVDAASPTTVTSVSVTTKTPGYTAAIYGARVGPPPSLQAPGWTLLAGPRTVSRSQTFPISGSAQYRYFLVYVTSLPPTGRADVNELSVLP